MYVLRRTITVLIAVLLIGTLSAVAQSIKYTSQVETTETAPLQLTEIYTTSDGLKSFRYPNGWLIRDVHGTDADVANTQEALDYDFGDTFQSGVVIVNVTASIFGGGDTPLNLLQSIYESGGEAVKSQFDPPALIQIDDRPAAFMIIPSQIYDVQIVLIEISPNIIGSVQVTAAPGELDQWLPTAMAIAESITYNGEVEATPEITEATPLPLTETYTTENGMFGIEYPDGWTLETYDPMTPGDWHLSATLFNKELLTPDQIFPPGTVSLDVTVTDIENFVLGVQRDPSEMTPEDIVRFRWFGLSADQDAMVNDLILTPAPNSDFQRGSIQPLMVGEAEAAGMNMETTGFNESFALAYIDNDIVVEIRVITAPSELNLWKPTALAIAEGFHYFG